MRHLQELGQSRVQFPFGDQLRNLIQLDHRLHLIFRLNLIDRHNLIRRDTPPNPFPNQTTVLLPINPLQLQKEPPGTIRRQQQHLPFVQWYRTLGQELP
ncbi:hypothetical protein NDA12_001199 [Ustilago hordei]|nr:hypothetical protein NDA12_001199 [Ustilago hordei]